LSSTYQTISLDRRYYIRQFLAELKTGK